MEEELLAKFNIKKDNLTQDERTTLQKWAEMVSQKQITPLEVKGYIEAMIPSLERELAGYDNPPMSFANLIFRGRRERHIKARLQNYLMLRDFLTAPDRARSYVEKQLGNFKPK
jgi:hypothetical protein